jgi:dihydroorotate dehydrogenase
MVAREREREREKRDAFAAAHRLPPRCAGAAHAGSVTPQPQPGNPKPRVFRVPAAAAIINRYGFNSEGGEMVERRLKVRGRRVHTLADDTHV